MSTKTVYADTDAGRLRADLPDDHHAVLVGKVEGGTLGWYNLDRFEGGKLTAATLRKLFARKD